MWRDKRVRDADAADEPGGRKDVVVVRYDETIDRESSPVNPFGTGALMAKRSRPKKPKTLPSYAVA